MMLVKNEQERVQLVSIQVDPWKEFNKDDYNMRSSAEDKDKDKDMSLKALNKVINKKSSKQMLGSNIKNCQLITKNIHGKMSFMILVQFNDKIKAFKFGEHYTEKEAEIEVCKSSQMIKQ
jgi:hypothetical protein